jgi:hypothetical protein
LRRDVPLRPFLQPQACSLKPASPYILRLIFLARAPQKPTFRRPKTAFLLAPRPSDPLNVKLGKNKSRAFFTFLIRSWPRLSRSWVCLIDFDREIVYYKTYSRSLAITAFPRQPTTRGPTQKQGSAPHGQARLATARFRHSRPNGLGEHAVLCWNSRSIRPPSQRVRTIIGLRMATGWFDNRVMLAAMGNACIAGWGSTDDSPRSTNSAANATR